VQGFIGSRMGSGSSQQYVSQRDCADRDDKNRSNDIAPSRKRLPTFVRWVTAERPQATPDKRNETEYIFDGAKYIQHLGTVGTVCCWGTIFHAPSSSA
jgi:hypothetical protein